MNMQAKIKRLSSLQKEFIMKPHNKPNENFNNSWFKHYIRGQKSGRDESVALLMHEGISCLRSF